MFKCNIKKLDSRGLNVQSTFWKEIIILWSEINYKPENITSCNVKTECIWLNSLIKSGNKVLNSRGCIKKNLVYLGQLVQNEKIY